MKPRQNKKPKYLQPGTIILIKQVFFGLVVFSSVAVIIAAVWYGTRIETFTIKNIAVSGGVTISENRIRDLVNEKLEGTFLGLVPKRFSFWYPEEEIYNSLSAVERIKTVSVEKKSGTDLSIKFKEYIPDNLWCGTIPDSDCFFLDEDGYSFAKAPELSGGSLIRYFVSSTDAEVGKKPLTKEDYLSTKEFTDELYDIGWFVGSVEINSARDVFYTLVRGSELKVALSNSAINPFQNLQTILQSKEFNHLEPGNFQYVDLRFEGRAYVNEELMVVATASSTDSSLENKELDISGIPVN
jgi:hypothetical protein